MGDYAADCRCGDSTKVSHGKRKGQGNVQNGHPYVSGASAAAATWAMRLHPSVPRSSQRKQAKTKVPVALQTVAHKLARACSPRMRHQGPFEVAKALGDAIGAVGLRREAGRRDGGSPAKGMSPGLSLDAMACAPFVKFLRRLCREPALGWPCVGEPLHV